MNTKHKFTSKHYVDNDKFVAAIEEYKKQYSLNPETRISEYIGFCIMEICTRFSLRPNFVNYSYREDMIGDAIENCIRYIKNFDSSKSTNAFAYFTQIAYFAFIRRLAREKKQSMIKQQAQLDAFCEQMNAFALSNDEMITPNDIAEIHTRIVQQSSQSMMQYNNSSLSKKPSVVAKKDRKLTKSQLTALEMLLSDSETAAP